MGMFSRVKNKLDQYMIDAEFIKMNNFRGRGRILMYHGIDLTQSRKFNSRHIGINNLEKQLLYFKKKFNLVSLEEFFDEDIQKNEKFTIAITFDDGFLNNFKYAFPLLDKYKIPAAFFVTGMSNSKYKILWPDLYDLYRSVTDKDFELNGQLFVKKHSDNHFYSKEGTNFYEFFKHDLRVMEAKMDEIWRQFFPYLDTIIERGEEDDYWQLMKDEEIKKVAKSSNVEIGSHGFYHNNLGLISENVAVEELRKSKEYLENLTQKEIISVAYPDGSYSRELVDKAYLLGFKRQLAVDYLYEDDVSDPRIQDRFGIYALPKPENERRTAYQILNS